VGVEAEAEAEAVEDEIEDSNNTMKIRNIANWELLCVYIV